MTNSIKKWIICAFLFLIGVLIIRFLDGKKITEGYEYGMNNRAINPMYIYDDEDEYNYYSDPYWYKYNPFTTIDISKSPV